MKILVIYNPVAGITKSNELETIEAFLTNNNLTFDLEKTTIENGPSVILSKQNKDYKAIVACGGDGTVSETINGMHKYKYDCPLLIVPTGTSNEIAQNLGFTDESIDIVLNRLLQNEISTLDYGLINENNTFTYALTFGNFTEVTYKTPQQMKNWLGYRAYLLYGFLTFRKVKSYRLKIKTNNINISGNYVFGAISNSKSIGNIVHYDENEISLCDGKFEVLLISKPTTVKELRLIITGLIQNKYTNEMFTIFTTNKIKIQSKNNINWNTDGEFGGAYKNLTVSNLRKKIKLLV